MNLSSRQRTAPKGTCEAFCPSGDGVATARELGVADAVIDAGDQNPRGSERRQLQALLGLWDAPALASPRA
jgi:hypothetical protein